MKAIHGANAFGYMAMVLAVPVLAWTGRGFAAVRESVARDADLNARAAGDVRGRTSIDSAAIIRMGVLRMAQHEWIVEAKSVSLGAAAVTRRIQLLAEETGIRLESVQRQTSRPLRSDRLRFRTSVAGPLTGVAEFLAALEQGPPRTLVREFTISVSGGSENASQQVKAQIVVELVLELTNRSTGFAIR